MMRCPHCRKQVELTLLVESDSKSKQEESENEQIELLTGGVGGVGSESGSVSDLGSGSLEARSAEVVSKIGFSLEFMQFWAIYPKKKNKGDAWKAWRTERPSLANLLNALSWQCLSHDWTKEAGQYVPYPAKYLRAKGWMDEPAKNVVPGASGSATRAPAKATENMPPPLRCEIHTKKPYWTQPAPVDWCSSCREQKARNGTRAGEPMELGELMPEWALKGTP